MKKNVELNVIRVFANYLIVLHHATSTCQYIQNKAWEYFTWQVIYSVAIVVALPALFLISGFLLMNSFSMLTFKDKFVRRIKRLFVPFVIWNATLVVFYLVSAHVIPRLATRVEAFHLDTWSGAVTKTISFIQPPLDLPLWYLRALLIYTLISPIIWYGLKICKGIFVYIALAIWFVVFTYFGWGDHLVHSYPFYSLLCFVIGAHISLAKKSLFDFLQNKGVRYGLSAVSAVGIVMYCIHSYFWDYYYSIYRDVSLILTTPALFIVVFYLGRKISGIKGFQFLTQSSFFLYAGHFLFCSMLLHAIGPLLNGMEFMGKETLLVTIFVIGGCSLLLGFYAIAKRLFGGCLAPWDGTL